MRIELPVDSPVLHTWVVIGIWIVTVLVILWPLTLYLRFNRLVRQGDSSNFEFRQFVAGARSTLLRRIMPLLLLATMWIIFSIQVLLDNNFRVVHVDQQGIMLDYADLVERDIWLEWSEIEDIELRKKFPRHKWYLVIRTVDGREYRSAWTSTYKEANEMLEAFKKLKRARQQTQAGK